MTLLHKRKVHLPLMAIIVAIRSFSHFAKKTDCIKDIRIVKAPNLYREAPVALERKEVLRIMREVDRGGNKRDKAILLTCIYAGIRVAEIVALDIDDISFSERQGTIRVRQGKGNKERIIPLHKEARYAVSDYLKTRESTADALFLSNRQTRISKRTVQRHL